MAPGPRRERGGSYRSFASTGARFTRLLHPGAAKRPSEEGRFDVLRTDGT